MSGKGRIPLGDVAEFINGVAFKPNDWSDEGQRIIRIQNLTDSSKPYNRTTRVVAEKYHVHPGDLLVSWSATLGVFVWDQSDVGLLNQHIFRVVPNRDRVDAGYLRQMLIDALVEMERHLHGATMKHVNRREFLATTIPLPPLAEQKRIAGILDAADALRAKRRESLAQLDTLLQSTFLDLFGDPVTNPMGWEEQPFGSLGSNSFRNGLSPSTKGTVGGVVLTLSAITGGSFDFTARKAAHFDKEPSAHQRLATDTFLICRGNGNKKLVGTGAFPSRDGEAVCFPDTMIGVTVDSAKLAPAYLQSIWQSRHVRRQIESGARTTNGSYKVNQKLLTSIVFPVPPLDLQHRFATIVESIERQKARLRAHLAELNALFASLQSRAFSGDL